ncbi:hypothetical protein BTVI_94304 [Pitangus sulphuratus]|nr:hypothetical protein BTVI_94304 [Pitangus sulphuratus]
MQLVAFTMIFARCMKPLVVNVYLDFARKSCCFKTGFQLLCSSCLQQSYEVHQFVEIEEKSAGGVFSTGGNLAAGETLSPPALQMPNGKGQRKEASGGGGAEGPTERCIKERERKVPLGLLQRVKVTETCSEVKLSYWCFLEAPEEQV